MWLTEMHNFCQALGEIWIYLRPSDLNIPGSNSKSGPSFVSTSELSACIKKGKQKQQASRVNLLCTCII